MSPRKAKRPPGYNRRVICGYVSGDKVLKRYERLVKRVNAEAGKEHKVTLSALAGRVLERILPFFEKRSAKSLFKACFDEPAPQSKP